MNSRKLSISCLVLSIVIILSSFKVNEWGFYGHRKINEMAIFTLPSEMFGFFKKNVTYISEHSVDPDKRRYATKHEAVRHYIDIDHWGENPFDEVPKNFDEALLKYGTFHSIVNEDTSLISMTIDDRNVELMNGEHTIGYFDFLKIFRSEFKVNYYEDQMSISGLRFNELMGKKLVDDESEVLFQDHFSEYGICPYHLVSMFNILRNAFESKDRAKILRTLAEYGHYIGDAHVPLHTTENYNGQLTGQDGIHAFWESRIVELFDSEFDYFVGKADYIDNVSDYVWKIIEDSHNLVDSVLLIEKRLRKEYPSDQQYCYDERLQRTIRIECPDFAYTYMLEMDGMVQNRMTNAVHAIGSLWYTAWVDAGQPNLNNLIESEIKKEVIVPNSEIKTRLHE